MVTAAGRRAILVSMSRRNATDYAGAVGRTTLERARQLGASWVLQPKVDGVYARVHLDSRGRISAVYSRTGAAFSRELVGELLGAFVGAPHAELVGELEAHTEAGNRAAATRGHRVIHLHDCIRDGQRYLAREPYRVRRDALWRMQSEAECYGPARYEDEDHGVRDRATGRFARGVLGEAGWRRTPIVGQRPAAQVELAWAEWVELVGGEGLVVVNLDAPLGARGSKLKLKQTEEREAVVVSADRRACTLSWAGRRFVVGQYRRDPVRPGEVVSFRHDGFYEKTWEPRFARIVRRRPDLAGTIAG